MEKELIDAWFSKQSTFPFTILEQGSENQTDGPDILDALLEIDSHRYRGSVEFDWNARSWFYHGHFQHPFYRHVILHVYKESQHHYHGNKPLYSYNITQNKLYKIEQGKASFLERKLDFLNYYQAFLSIEKLFLLFFSRSLGYFHNREELMYFAYHLLHGRRLDLSYYQSKAQRPNNQFKKRQAQVEYCVKRSFLFHEFKLILYEGLSLKNLIGKLHKLCNKEGEGIGKERLTQFLFNWALALFYRLNEENGSSYFRSYLGDLFEALKVEDCIRKIHQKSDLDFPLSALSSHNGSTISL